MPLIKENCQPCSKVAIALSSEQAQLLLTEIPQWTISVCDAVDHLIRAYVFERYTDALHFTLKVGEMADFADHHPTLITTWGMVTIHWWTHSINGLHKNDFIMAAKSDQLYNELTTSG